MPTVERYAPGSFCWVENVTDDAETAKAFYREVMGWRIPETPGFAMLSIEREPIGALYALPASAWEGSARPHWLLYVAVDDAAAAAARARELGGDVVREPFDTGGGWSAWLRDPEGAVFAVWQAGANPGARREGEPGTLCWPELGSADPEAAAAFYGGLFGWRARDSGSPDEPYAELDLDGSPIGGLRSPRDGAGAGWMPFFQVADCDSTVDRASAAGGRVLEPPADFPGIGRMAVLTDARGAAFAIIRLGGTEGELAAETPTRSKRPGEVLWIDLTVPDAPPVRDFYREVVGFSVAGIDMGGYEDFTLAPPGGEPVAGVCHARGGNADMPPQWLVYFAVDDLDASLAKVASAGGATLVGPKEMPGYGRYAVVRDPAGAVAALFQPA